jgi:hypothetical protein
MLWRMLRKIREIIGSGAHRCVGKKAHATRTPKCERRDGRLAMRDGPRFASIGSGARVATNPSAATAIRARESIPIIQAVYQRAIELPKSRRLRKASPFSNSSRKERAVPSVGRKAIYIALKAIEAGISDHV